MCRVPPITCSKETPLISDAMLIASTTRSFNPTRRSGGATATTRIGGASGSPAGPSLTPVHVRIWQRQRQAPLLHLASRVALSASRRQLASGLSAVTCSQVNSSRPPFLGQRHTLPRHPGELWSCITAGSCTVAAGPPKQPASNKVRFGYHQKKQMGSCYSGFWGKVQFNDACSCASVMRDWVRRGTSHQHRCGLAGCRGGECRSVRERPKRRFSGLGHAERVWDGDDTQPN